MNRLANNNSNSARLRGGSVTRQDEPGIRPPQCGQFERQTHADRQRRGPTWPRGQPPVDCTRGRLDACGRPAASPGGEEWGGTTATSRASRRASSRLATGTVSTPAVASRTALRMRWSCPCYLLMCSGPASRGDERSQPAVLELPSACAAEARVASRRLVVADHLGLRPDRQGRQQERRRPIDVAQLPSPRPGSRLLGAHRRNDVDGMINHRRRSCGQHI